MAPSGSILPLDPECTRRGRPRPDRVNSAPALLPGALPQVQWRPDEAELLAEAALDEAEVRRLELARREQDEGRWCRLGLGPEQHLRLLATAHRVWMLGDQAAEEGVERAGGYAGLPALEGGGEGGYEAVYVPARTRGDVDPGRPGHTGQLPFDLALEHRAALVVDEVPFVEDQDHRASGLGNRGDDALILLGQRLSGVEHHDGDFGTLDGGVGTQARVVLVTGCLAYPAPDAGRVDEPPGPAGQLDELVDRVDGRAGRRVDHDPILAGQPVEQTRLADVGLAHDGDPARAALVGLLLDQGGRQGCHDRVEQIATPPAVQGRNGVRLADSQGPQGRRLGLATLVVDLVRGQDDRLPGASQDADHGLVGVGDADGRVNDEEHGVRCARGQLRLTGDR